MLPTGAMIEMPDSSSATGGPAVKSELAAPTRMKTGTSWPYSLPTIITPLPALAGSSDDTVAGTCG